MDFSDCLVSDGTPNDIILLFKKFTYNLSVWLPTFHAAFLEEFNLSGGFYY